MAQGREERVVAVLGRRDEPTDAVEAYCQFLGSALTNHGLAMEIRRVPWCEHGWNSALRELRAESASWRGRWVFVQYTALAWSARGFSWRFVGIVSGLRRAGARVAIVYHDAEPYPARRWAEKIRRAVQVRAMRQALAEGDLAIFTVPREKISWFGKAVADNACFIPVGANLPLSHASHARTREAGRIPTVSVFGVTGGNAGEQECAAITAAVQFASRQIGRLCLDVFGRHADEAESCLREALRDFPVDLRVSAVLPAEQVAERLSCSDVMVFVRGPVSSRRGSAIAGIACGLPVIAWAGSETAPPITEAGVVLVAPDDHSRLGEALARVLQDHEYRESLSRRSRDAHRKYFSWEAIAQSYVQAIEKVSR